MPDSTLPSTMGSLLSHPPAPPQTLKRTRAVSEPCDGQDVRLRKRSRANPSSALMAAKITEESEDDTSAIVADSSTKGKGKAQALIPAAPPSAVFGGPTAAVIDDLAQELTCGCCTELCYKPVIVNPCQHYFCGSCCVLWVRNGGTNCPACRGVSTSVTPSRVLQSMLDLLLRAAPARARTAGERAQADKVYREGTALRLPTPRPATPEPNLDAGTDNFARPCPTCLPGNAYGWRCPVPIADPVADPEGAFDLEDGLPRGHNFCGHCDQLHGVAAPTSSRCDLCQVSFCGVGIQGRCCAVGLLHQQPQGMAELQDLILSGSVYECFQRNSVEIDILVDYLRVNDMSLRNIYKEIITHMLQHPRDLTALIDAGVFDDLHLVAGGEDPDPAAPRRRACRLCAAQVLVHGLRDWWVRERRAGRLPAEVRARGDCAAGAGCERQVEQAHAKEFNHIIQPPLPPPPPPASAPPVPPAPPAEDVDVDMLAPPTAAPPPPEAGSSAPAPAPAYTHEGEDTDPDPEVVLEMLGPKTPRPGAGARVLSA